MRNLIKQILKEEYGRDYSVQSLYDIIKDDLINHPTIKGWVEFTKSMGSLNDFLSQHETDPDELIMKGDVVQATGNQSILAAVLAPILTKMGIIEMDQFRNDPNTIKIVNKMAKLLYQDIKPEYNPDL